VSIEAQKIYKINLISSKPDYHQAGIIDLRIKTPDQHHRIMVRQGKGGGHICVVPPGMEMGQLAKKWGLKEKWMDSMSLAKRLNYHRQGRSCGYDLLVKISLGWG